VPVSALREDFDATVLCGGATAPRDLQIPGREAAGIHFAVDYLTQQNRRCEGDAVDEASIISAEGRRVVIIGGGDTGADCLGTAHRQGARSVAQFELMPRPPASRAADNPWPQWPAIFRSSAAHEEGGERVYSVSTERFLADANGCVSGISAVNGEVRVEAGRLRFIPAPETAFEIETDLVLLAMGFTGVREEGLLSDLGVTIGPRSAVATDVHYRTNVPGVFAAGDMRRGQSLVVWAINEGREAARECDRYLMGDTLLP
jgi:glutamate synthase (NADPH/NADH) small chain